jgi:glyoxylase-like metal-dependent hydrolase (beta-lactamase superfamily II)
MARATKPRTQAGPAPTGATPGRDVTVRMYRVGLGDCFLLRFRDGSSVSSVLIDCGSLGRLHPSLGADIDAVAASLKALTGGTIDLVVATHEHADHLSGYRGEDTPFKEFTFREVWMSWCDNPGDQTAERLRVRKAAALKALQATRARFAATGQAERLAAIDEVLEFAALGARASGGGGWTGAALGFLREKAGGNLRYPEPGGEPLGISGVPGVRVFVLGPPRDESMINRVDEKGATYGLAFGEHDAATAATLANYLKPGLDDAERRAFEEALPFDADHPLRVTTPWLAPPAEGGLAGSGAAADGGGEAALAAWLGGRFPGDEHRPDVAKEIEEVVALVAGLRERYYGDGGDQALWRQIEEDWLDSPETLALKLDNATNNTSLALAIELPDGRVLLFPADAQVGNWQSWARLSWPGLGAGGAHLTARDLLARTVLYKVGHHGSHNATLRAQGLELMTSESLVAMLPVDHEFACVKKHWCRMPLDDLVDRLEEKTAGRLIRADVSHADLVAKTPRTGAWKAFVDAIRTEDDKLYIEHVIPY